MYRSSKQKMIRRIGLSSVAAATALGLGFTVANASTTHSTGTQSIAAKAIAGCADAPTDRFGQFNALEVHGSVSALTATSVTLTDHLVPSRPTPWHRALPLLRIMSQLRSLT